MAKKIDAFNVLILNGANPLAKAEDGTTPLILADMLALKNIRDGKRSAANIITKQYIDKLPETEGLPLVPPMLHRQRAIDPVAIVEFSCPMRPETLLILAE